MSEKQVKDQLFAAFLIFMRGQTVSQDEKGETIYYPWDVEPFIKRVEKLAKNMPVMD